MDRASTEGRRRRSMRCCQRRESLSWLSQRRRLKRQRRHINVLQTNNSGSVSRPAWIALSAFGIVVCLYQGLIVLTAAYVFLDHRANHMKSHPVFRGASSCKKVCPSPLLNHQPSDHWHCSSIELRMATSSSDLKKKGGQITTARKKGTTTKVPQKATQYVIPSSSTSKPSNGKPSQSLQHLVPKKKTPQNRHAKRSKRQLDGANDVMDGDEAGRYDNDDDDEEEELERREAARLDMQNRKSVVTRLARAAREAAKARREKEQLEEEMRRIDEEEEEDYDASEEVKNCELEQENILDENIKNEKDIAPSLSSLRNTLKIKNKRRRYKSGDQIIRAGIVNNMNIDDLDEIPSISALNGVIDSELLHPNDGSARPPRETQSMRALLQHNILYDDDDLEINIAPHKKTNDVADDNNNDVDDDDSVTASLDQEKIVEDVKTRTDKKMKARADRNIAVVFARPLVDGQVSVEYAARIASLAKHIQSGEYRPDLIYFCGSFSSKRTFDIVPEGAAGIVYFRHLCAANNICLEGIDMVWIRGHRSSKRKPINGNIPEDEDQAFGMLGGLTSPPPPMDDEDMAPLTYNPWSASALQPIVDELLESGYVKQWLQESELFESETDEYGLIREAPRKKISIHWTLVSTDYDLCSLNNIHVRSPRRSPLETFRLLQQRISKQYRGICVNTWSFKYTVYPFVYSSDDVLAAFLGKCFLLAQEVLPVLVNIWGVAQNSEFFQKDNYSALVASRRSLASLMEEMNTAFQQNQARTVASMTVPPTLKSRLQHYSDPKKTRTEENDVEVSTVRTNATISTIDIQLEGALLSLGRCADLVRPAGTFSSQPVSQNDWRLAVHHLQDFMNRMERGCDPDRPLPAHRWGDLDVGNVIE